MMNRRTFLSSLFGAVAASAVPKVVPKPTHDQDRGDFVTRMDVLYGFECVPECVIVG